MAGLTGVGGSNETYLDQLVNSYKASQQTKITALDQKKSKLESTRNFFLNLNNRLNTFVSQLDKFSSSTIADNFKKQKVNSSDSTVATATSSGSAEIQDFNIKVNRKASNDILISKSISINDSFGVESGTKSLEFILNGETKTVQVEFNGDETNEQAMKKIVNAINLLNNDEDENNNIAISATYVKDTTTTGRISFNSKESGADNRIKFNDSELFAKLGLDKNNLNSENEKRKYHNGLDAGYKVEDYNDLNSNFELNGIDITRGSNSIDDVIEGVTINLLKVQESDSTAVSLNTEVDTKSVEDFINPLLKSFNDIFNFVNSNKEMRRSESTISGMIYNLRNTATSQLGDGSNGGFKYLSDIGITVGTNGDLSISDTKKLKDALVKNVQAVSDLFTNPNGFIAKLNESISTLKGDSGLLETRTLNLSNQIEEAKKKTETAKTRIEDQANVLRKQYTSYLKLLYEAQGQSNLTGMMSSGLTGSSY